MDKQTDMARKGELAGALVGLARALEGKLPSSNADRLLLSGLAAASAGSQLSEESLAAFLEMIHREKAQAAPDCAACQSPCGRTDDYDMAELLSAEPSLFTGKFLLLQSLCAIASMVYPLDLHGELAAEALAFLYEGLFMLGYAYEAGQLGPRLETAGNLVQKLLPLLAEE